MSAAISATKGETSIEAMVTLLAMKTRRPVRGVFSREENSPAPDCGSRHRLMRARIGVADDGKILAFDSGVL